VDVLEVAATLAPPELAGAGAGAAELEELLVAAAHPAASAHDATAARSRTHCRARALLTGVRLVADPAESTRGNPG